MDGSNSPLWVPDLSLKLNNPCPKFPSHSEKNGGCGDVGVGGGARSSLIPIHPKPACLAHIVN